MKTAAIVLAILIITFTVEAQFVEVDLGTNVNENIQTYSTPGNYELGGSQLLVDGVPFLLAELNTNANTTGVVQGGGTGHDGYTGPFEFTFPVPAGTQATVLYTLLNTVYGTAGLNEGSIVVIGAGGETATLNLVEGFNIRDCNNSSWDNSVSDPTIISTYFLNGSVTAQSIQTRLDRQELFLPAAFSGDTIASITFQGVGQGNPNGSAFLAGMTLYSPPQLTITASGTNVILTWTNTSGFILQSSTDLSPASWISLSSPPVLTNGQYTVITPMANTQQYYRLSQ